MSGLTVTNWLIEKPALVRLVLSPKADEWAARIEPELVRITTVTRLETYCSARSGRTCGPGRNGRPCHPCQWNT